MLRLCWGHRPQMGNVLYQSSYTILSSFRVFSEREEETERNIERIKGGLMYIYIASDSLEVSLSLSLLL